MKHQRNPKFLQSDFVDINQKTVVSLQEKGIKQLIFKFLQNAERILIRDG
jgi:hypothetical protein